MILSQASETKIKALRERCMFDEGRTLFDSILSKQVASRINTRDCFTSEKHFTEQTERREQETVELMASLISMFDSRVETFPLRHRLNLAMSLASNHAEWASKMQGVLSQPDAGSIYILTGPRGTGKTELATAVARASTERASRFSQQYEDGPIRVVCDFTSAYAVLGDLFTRIKGTFKSDSSESEDSIMGGMIKPRLLVLDEVHEISGTPWQGRIFTLLADARYRSMRDTILITNHDRNQFLDAVGESIADRLRETGFFVECHWQSFRGAGR